MRRGSQRIIGVGTSCEDGAGQQPSYLPGRRLTLGFEVSRRFARAGSQAASSLGRLPRVPSLAVHAPGGATAKLQHVAREACVTRRVGDSRM